jgi:hypothetical protein
VIDAVWNSVDFFYVDSVLRVLMATLVSLFQSLIRIKVASMASQRIFIGKTSVARISVERSLRYVD